MIGTADAIRCRFVRRRAVYDCLYLALAINEGCQLVTADLALVNQLATTCPFLIDLAEVNLRGQNLFGAVSGAGERFSERRNDAASAADQRADGIGARRLGFREKLTGRLLGCMS
jgi:hypothetical protein